MSAAIETWICRACKVEKPKTDFHRAPKRKGGVYPYCKPCNIARVREHYRRPGNAERKKAYDLAYRETNRDRLEVQWRENYERNKPRALEYAKAWAAKNPEKRRAVNQAYKHRRRSVEKTGITWKELEAWKRLQAKVCYWCDVKCSRGFVIDHYHPLAKGGKHEVSNLVISCRSCNARKSAKDPLDFAREVGRLL